MNQKEYRYTLEKGSKKHYCPSCNRKRFVKYIDTETGKYLPEQYGRCDREINCDYNLSPYLDGYARAIWEQEQGYKTNWTPHGTIINKKPVKQPKTTFIPVEILIHTQNSYAKNIFIQNLLLNCAFPFEVEDIEKVISMYHLGTIKSGYRKGAITFPFIDQFNNIRAIQVKQFNKQNSTIATDYLHSIIEKRHKRNNEAIPDWLNAYNENDAKVSCLFGEHLLKKFPNNPIALVEAPKTAIYSTLYFGFPEQLNDLIWLAVYNLSSLNLNKCAALVNRNVYLFPDLSKEGRAYQLWSNKAREIEKNLQGANFKVSDLLERLATQQDREKGKDLADYLITQDWRQFRS